MRWNQDFIYTSHCALCVQSARREGSSLCFLHPCNSYFFNWNSASAKISKTIAAANETKFLSMLSMHWNAVFDWSHLVNDIDFSIEISYFPWIWVVIWQSIYFPVARLSPHWDWFNLVDSLKVSTQNLPKCKTQWSQGAQKFIMLLTFSKKHINVELI